ncbi:MFS transporter [Cohnella kolymensis]|uniref:MFS transporter n=1 Tax=Cohnella kolymensis TaxID=1590652 RepID=UPI001F46F33F|nr:MFS transporter [Cohnella kolymensis]
MVGASAASVIGRLADRASPTRMVGFMIAAAILSYVCFWLAGSWLVGLVVGVVLLDLGVQGAQVSNQARVYALIPEARSRLNTVYMVSVFIGGAIGSSIGAYSWVRWGWNGTCIAGGAMTLAAFVVWAMHRMARK